MVPSTKLGSSARSRLGSGLQHVRSRVTREWRRGTLLAGGLTALTIILIWFWPELPVHAVDPSSSQTLDMLSGQAQSLAAVFALVLTVSLIVAQLASRHSPRVLSDYFDQLTIFYLVGFIFAVLVPLWALNQPNPILIRLTATCTAATLYWLIPYFLRFRDRVDPEHELARLADRIISLLNKPLPPRGSPVRDKMLETAISTQAKIADYLASSFGFKEYATFEVCVDEMARIVMHTFTAHDSAEDNRGCPLCKAVRYQILNQLRDTALRTIDDPWTPNVIVAAINSVHSKTEAERLKNKGEDLLEALAAIGMFAVERRLDVIAKDVALGMGALGRYTKTQSSREEWPVVPSAAVGHLGELGKSSTIRHLESTPRQVVTQIESLGKDSVPREAVTQLYIIGKAAIEERMQYIVRAAATSIEGIVRSNGRDAAAIEGVRFLAKLGQVAILEERPDDAGVAVLCLLDIGTKVSWASDYIRQEVVKGLVVIRDQAAGSKQSMTTVGARAIPEFLDKAHRGVQGVDLRLVDSFAEAARAVIPVRNPH